MPYLQERREKFKRLHEFLTAPSEINLPGYCWAEIQQLALIGSSSSLHSEACNAVGASDGVIHSSISLEVVSLRPSTNTFQMHFLWSCG